MPHGAPLPSPVVHPSDLAVERAVDLLATMAHPARLSVLSWLHRRGPTSVGELVEALGVEQTAMSHHLRHLREARLVETERQGKRVVYRLVDDHVGCIVEDALRHADEVPAPPVVEER
ncbi:MAG: metalloregulator ArsR/SmtB family transcription factor [Myxococcota bacterium]